MKLRVRAKPEGIPNANVTSAPGVTNLGAPQVTAYIAALDAFQIPDIVAHLVLSTSEARELAARLTKAAGEADALAVRDAKCAECGDPYFKHSGTYCRACVDRGTSQRCKGFKGSTQPTAPEADQFVTPPPATPKEKP